MIRLPPRPRTALAPKSAPVAEPVEQWTVLGIDTSTTRMGLAVLRAGKGQVPTVLHAGDTNHSDLQSHNRQKAQTEDIVDLLNKYRPDFVVIEAPVAMRGGGAASSTKVLGQNGVVRYLVNRYGYEYRTTTPPELKKYVTGSGSAKKPQMKATVEKRWGFAAKNHDIADAYGLAHMGLAGAGLIPKLTQEEREIIGNMKIERPE